MRNFLLATSAAALALTFSAPACAAPDKISRRNHSRTAGNHAH